MFEYKAGDLIWAKMRGFCPWPARIMAADECKKMKRPSMKKPMQPVFFFGYENHAWIEETFIKPFFKFKNDLSNNKTAKLRDAVKACEDYISKNSEAAKQQKKREEGTDEAKATPKIEKREPTPEKPTPEPKSEKGKRKKSLASSETPKPTKKAKLSNSSNHTPQNGTTPKTSPPKGTPKIALKRPKIKPPESFYNMDVIKANPAPRKSSAAHNFLSRASAAPRPEVVPVDVKNVSKDLAAKKIVPTSQTIGFIGLGNIGSGIVKNLLHSGHKVNIWNRTAEMCDPFVEINASKVMTPQDVVSSSDIVFCCVSNAKAAHEMVFGNCGVLSGMEEGKSYIELTTIDETTSKATAEAISHKGGHYLEAQIQGNKRLALEGNLVIIAAGSRTAFDEAQTCFQAMSKENFYVGETVGTASRMNLIIQTISGINLVALAEGMSVASKAGLEMNDTMEIFGKTLNASQFFMEKIHEMMEGVHDPRMAVSLMQKDMACALRLGEQFNQHMPVSAAAHEVYKHTSSLGYSDYDVSAVYLQYRYY